MEVQWLWLWVGVLLGGSAGLLWRRRPPATLQEAVEVAVPEAAVPEAEASTADTQFLQARYYQALELAQFKGGFLARTAHELRSPLSSLMGLHQLILADLCDSPEEERECVAQAYEAAQNFYGLLETLIEVSQLELGRKSLDIQPLELDVLLEDVMTSVGLPLADRNVRFRVVHDEAIPPAVKADYGCLRQIAIQLILQATEQKATEIIWKCVSSPDGEQIGFVLSDNRAPEVWQETLADWAQLQAREDWKTAEMSAEEDLMLKRQWQPVQLSPGLSLWVQRSLLEVMGGRLELLAGTLGETRQPGGPGLSAFLESPPPQDQLCCWLTRA